MSDIGTLNKQCRQCPKIIPDGGGVEYGGYVVCADCDKTLPKSDLIYAMIIVSYADSTAISVREIIRELEKERESAKREAAYWRQETAMLRKTRRQIVGNA